MSELFPSLKCLIQIVISGTILVRSEFDLGFYKGSYQGRNFDRAESVRIAIITHKKCLRGNNCKLEKLILI